MHAFLGILRTVFAILRTESRVLHAFLKILFAVLEILHTVLEILRTELGVLHAGLEILRTECRILRAECRVLLEVFRPFEPGSGILHVVASKSERETGPRKPRQILAWGISHHGHAVLKSQTFHGHQEA